MKKQLGSKLRQLRKSYGITQSELARQLGISGSAVGMYEQGRREPDSTTLLKICSFFGISSDYLLGNGEREKTAASMEVLDVFDEFTRVLTSQPCLMLDGIPLNDEDRGKIVDAVNVVRALVHQQHRKAVEG